jgi:hypothetical protein
VRRGGGEGTLASSDRHPLERERQEPRSRPPRAARGSDECNRPRPVEAAGAGRDERTPHRQDRVQPALAALAGERQRRVQVGQRALGIAPHEVGESVLLAHDGAPPHRGRTQRPVDRRLGPAGPRHAVQSDAARSR